MASGAVERAKIKRRYWTARFWARIRLVTSLAFYATIGENVWTGSACYVGSGPLGVACPLGAVQIMVASQLFFPWLALAALIAICLVILFGRVFCGWICPGRWIFNHGPAKSPAPATWRKRSLIQGGIVGGVIGVAWIFHRPVFCILCPAGVLSRGAIAAGTGGSLVPAFGWLGALTGIEWASGRSWCRDLCPLGAAISWLSSLNPFLKFRANPQRCQPCRICTRACPEGLNLSQDIDFSTCTKCFACQSACPRNAVELKLM